HDWGGLLVWPFARRFPDRTAGVIGVNTPDLPHGHLSVIELLRMAFPDNPPYIIQFQDYGPAEYMLGRNRPAVDSWLRFVYASALRTRTAMRSPPTTSPCTSTSARPRERSPGRSRTTAAFIATGSCGSRCPRSSTRRH